MNPDELEPVFFISTPEDIAHGAPTPVDRRTLSEAERQGMSIDWWRVFYLWINPRFAPSPVGGAA